MRAAACALVAELGQQDAIERLRELSADPDAGVTAAADLTRGRLGDRTVKPILEQRLRAAAAGEISRFARALVDIADANTVVLLGRAAERADSSVRAAVVETLGEIDASAAVAWLVRFAGDESPDVRIAVARALAEHDDPRALAALRRLVDDSDPKVRACASVIVSE